MMMKNKERKRNKITRRQAKEVVEENWICFGIDDIYKGGENEWKGITRYWKIRRAYTIYLAVWTIHIAYEFYVITFEAA